jgi:hypothetical protein
MGAFDQIHIVTVGEDERTCNSTFTSLVVAESRCKIGNFFSKTMAAGLTVPLEARPSLGAGLWLQGGIGYLPQLHRLACDSIVGAVVVNVDSGQVFCIRHVPSQRMPDSAMRPNKRRK